MKASDAATDAARRRYDRLSRYYNMMEWAAERKAFTGWRHRLWGLVEGPRVLEVGVGTGKNIPHYPEGLQLTAIDFSPGMLLHARELASRSGAPVDLREMDVQELDFPDGSFDSAITTFVFCSVPDPIRGLREIRRVLRPGGRAVLLEHVLSRRPVVRQLMHAANPMVLRMMGANINRETRRNLEAAGFRIITETDLWFDIVKLFVVQGRDESQAASESAPLAGRS